MRLGSYTKTGAASEIEAVAVVEAVVLAGAAVMIVAVVEELAGADEVEVSVEMLGLAAEGAGIVVGVDIVEVQVVDIQFAGRFDTD
jgi:uncharacterized membrane protein